MHASAISHTLLVTAIVAGAVGHAAAGERLLFLTSSTVVAANGVERRVHTPEPREIAFRFDSPWEGPQSGYATVLPDAEGFRLYYRGGGDLTREQTCVAFSKDGVAWTRPSLGLFEFEGRTDTNIVWMPQERKAYAESHNFFVFRDEAEGVEADARWKGVALHRFDDERGESQRMLVSLASPDGIKWRRLAATPAIREGGGFDSLNVAFRDPWTHDYRAFCRIGMQGYRFIAGSESPDFATWSMLAPIQFDPFPAHHFYTNAIQPVPSLRADDAGRWYVGMPMRFVPGRRIAMGRETDGLSDALLIASRDAVHWELVSAGAWIRPGLEPMNWGDAHSNGTPACGILATSPLEWSVYWTVQDRALPALRRGTLRPEGFASLHASAAGGTAALPPMETAGARVLLNASTSAAGSIRIEVLDAKGQPLPGFTLQDCDEVWGDGLFLPVAWKGRESIPPDVGPVSFRVELKDADLYAIRCQPAAQGS